MAADGDVDRLVEEERGEEAEEHLEDSGPLADTATSTHRARILAGVGEHHRPRHRRRITR